MNFTSDCFVFHTKLEKIYDSNFNFFQEVYPYIVSYSVYVSNKGLLNWTYSIAYIQIQKDRIQVFIITKVIYILMHTETNKLVNYIHILPAWISNIGNSGNTSFPQSKRWVLIKKNLGYLQQFIKRRFLAWLYNGHNKKNDTSFLLDHRRIEESLWYFFDIDRYFVYNCVVI